MGIAVMEIGAGLAVCVVVFLVGHWVERATEGRRGLSDVLEFLFLGLPLIVAFALLILLVMGAIGHAVLWLLGVRR